ncbi:MAG: hypothetical protein M3R09_01950 [Actinomycetota bacterium]|nr:hypothetical protein [Actinomycetota bacterium]
MIWSVQLFQGLGDVCHVHPQAEMMRALLERCAFRLCSQARPDQRVDRFAQADGALLSQRINRCGHIIVEHDGRSHQGGYTVMTRHGHRGAREVLQRQNVGVDDAVA